MSAPQRHRTWPVLSGLLLAVLFSTFAHAVADRTLSDGDAREMLAAHNRWRRTANGAALPDLKWNETLAARAQTWADRLAKESSCALAHSPSTDVGENLFWASAIIASTGAHTVEPVTPADVVDSWAAERANYDDKKNRCAPGQHCGHYTQLMWRTTREVGCGRAICESGHQVWVCQYSPTGNLGGKRPF